MRRSILTLALAALCGFGVSSVLAQAGGQTQAAVKAEARDATPESRVEGNEAMNGAVAAAVIGAVFEQFGEKQVEVKLDSVSVQPASLRDRNVSGEGRIRLGDDSTWIPFNYATLYDTTTTSVSYPRLVLGSADARSAPADAALTKSLWARADAGLRSEFSNQPLSLSLSRVTTRGAGSRYQHVQALGDVDFGKEGSTMARVDGLYDTKTHKWLRVAYELGDDANAAAGSRVVASAY